jgi:hypothetical protein
LKNEKLKEEIQTAWSKVKDISYSCRSFIICLDFKNDWFLSNSVSNQLQQKKIEKIVVLGFFNFSNFALNNTFPTRPHTCHSKTKWWINLQKSIRIFEGAIFKNHKKKKFKQAPLTTWTEHTSYSCCSLVIFIDFLKIHILRNSTSSHRNQFFLWKKLLLLVFLNFLNFSQYITFPTHSSTSFCNKNWLSYQRKYDGEIVENRKVGNPVGFLA